MKKILVILGHSSTESLCAYLAEKYCEGAKDSGNEIKRINVGELEFSPFLKKGYSAERFLEPDIKEAQKQITWANHLNIFVRYGGFRFRCFILLKEENKCRTRKRNSIQSPSMRHSLYWLKSERLSL